MPGDGLCRPSVDEVEGAEAQGDPRGQRDPAAVHPIHCEVRRDTQCAPTWHANCPGSLSPYSKFVSTVCRARMVSTRDKDIYTGSVLRGVIPYVQCRTVMFPC
jgi:hypothetical protein